MVMSLPTRFRHCARVWANKPKPQCGRDALIPADELVLITSSLAKTEVLEGARLGLPNPTKVENILDRSSEILDGDVGCSRYRDTISRRRTGFDLHKMK
jgi:hypothetical protein